MHVFRLVKSMHAGTPLDGEGARRVGGRWNPPGLAVAYCASSLSLAVLELLVHVDPANVPADLIAVEIEIPEGVPVRHLGTAKLPNNWRQEGGKAALQALGAAWIKARADVAFGCPLGGCAFRDEHPHQPRPARCCQESGALPAAILL